MRKVLAVVSMVAGLFLGAQALAVSGQVEVPAAPVAVVEAPAAPVVEAPVVAEAPAPAPAPAPSGGLTVIPGRHQRG
jgi:hypothetical protein